MAAGSGAAAVGVGLGVRLLFGPVRVFVPLSGLNNGETVASRPRACKHGDTEELPRRY